MERGRKSVERSRFFLQAIERRLAMRKGDASSRCKILSRVFGTFISVRESSYSAFESHICRGAIHDCAAISSRERPLRLCPFGATIELIDSAMGKT